MVQLSDIYFIQGAQVPLSDMYSLGCLGPVFSSVFSRMSGHFQICISRLFGFSYQICIPQAVWVQLSDLYSLGSSGSIIRSVFPWLFGFSYQICILCAVRVYLSDLYYIGCLFQLSDMYSLGCLGSVISSVWLGWIRIKFLFSSQHDLQSHEQFIFRGRILYSHL